MRQKELLESDGQGRQSWSGGLRKDDPRSQGGNEHALLEKTARRPEGLEEEE